MRTWILTVALLLSLVVNSFAGYNSWYLSKFIGKEIFIILNDERKHKEDKEILIRVIETDQVGNIVVGKSNEGTYHIDINNIKYIREQRANISGVYTN